MWLRVSVGYYPILGQQVVRNYFATCRSLFDFTEVRIDMQTRASKDGILAVSIPKKRKEAKRNAITVNVEKGIFSRSRVQRA
jgi:hypothetical protein